MHGKLTKSTTATAFIIKTGSRGINMGGEKKCTSQSNLLAGRASNAAVYNSLALSALFITFKKKRNLVRLIITLTTS